MKNGSKQPVITDRFPIRYHILLSKGMAGRLKKEAYEQDRTMSQIVRSTLREYFKGIDKKAAALDDG